MTVLGVRSAPSVIRYAIVSLQKNGETSYKRVHTLVAETFIPNPDNKREVNHIDGNKTNNNVDCVIVHFIVY